jgi:hypothetical protein
MARYKAKTKLFVNDTLVAEGTEFDSDQIPNIEFWEPLDDEAKVAISEAKQRAKQRAAEIKENLQVEGAAPDLAPLLARVSALADSVKTTDGLDSRVSAMEAVFVDLVRAAEFGAVAGSVDKLKADVSELDGGLQALSAQVSSHGATLSALAARPDVNPAPISEPEPAPPAEPEPPPQ